MYNNYFFLDDVSEEVQVLLTNALYFKDAWTKAFEMVPSEPKRMFTLLNGTEIDVTSKMMFRDSSDFLLVTNLTLDGLNSNFRFTVVSIPYNVSELSDVSIILFLCLDKICGSLLVWKQTILY